MAKTESEIFIQHHRGLLLDARCEEIRQQIRRLLPGGTCFAFVAFDVEGEWMTAILSKGYREEILQMLEDAAAKIREEMDRPPNPSEKGNS